jgi:phage-related protein
MANILGLAMKVTADASSVPKSLTQAERALNSLQAQVEKATKVFAPFTESSAGAARAQEQFAERFARLADQLQSKAVGPEEYAAAFAQLTEEAQQAADAFERGIELTQRYATAEEDRAAQLREIADLVEKGAISEQTAARARADLSGDAARLAEEERAIAAARADAAKVTAANMAPMEVYDQEVQRLTAHLAAGRINQETFDRAVAKATQTFTKAESAAKGYDKTVGDVGLKFNELSGVLSAIPGPIGNFAGRLSGLASASEGLTRVFAGGLTPGLASIGTSLASVVNPAALAAAGIAGIGAAAAGVVSGLSSLEAETERLQNAADKLGVSFDFMQTLQKAAEMSGVSFDAVNGAMTRLLKTLAGADEESKQATAALGRLGVSLGDLEGLDSEQQLKLIGERLKAIEAPAKRAAAATALFGKSGAELLPFFSNLGTAEQTLNRFNARLSEIDVGRVLALGDSFDAVKASLSGVGNELLTPFIGVTQSLGDGLASAIATFGRNIGAVLDIFSPLTSAIGLAGNVLLQFGSTIGNLIGTVLEPFAAQGRLISGVIDALSQAVTAVAGRVNDAIIGFREFFKFEGVAGSFRDTFAQIGEVVSRVAAIAEAALARLGSIIGNTLGRAATVVSEAVSQFLEFTGLGSVISGFAEAVSEAFSGLWDAIKFVVGQVGGFIEQVLQFAEEWLGVVPEIEKPVEVVVDSGAIKELIAESKTFQKTLEDITKGVSEAINESAKFGQAGFDAALKYETAVDSLKAKLDAGLFNEETFKREAEKAGTAFKAELARLEEDAKLDIQIKEDAQKTLSEVSKSIDNAIRGAKQFGDAGFDAALRYQKKLQDLGKQFEDGRINQTTLTLEIEKATQAYDRQVELVKLINRELFSTTETEKEIQFVLSARAQIEQDIATARKNNDRAAAESSQARLDELNKLFAKLDDQQQAIDQGFSEGFDKAFAQQSRALNDALQRTRDLGSAGVRAAQVLADGYAKAQQKAKDGIFNREAFENDIRRVQLVFDEQVKRLEELKARQDAARRDNFQAQIAANDRVNQLLQQQLGARTKAEIEAADAVARRRQQALENVAALQDRIAVAERSVAAARDQKDFKAARERKAELDLLKRTQIAEQRIADGRTQANRQQAQQLQQGSSAAQQFQSLVARQNDAFLQGFQNAYAGANNALAQGARVAEEQARRMEALTRPTNATVNVADIRTAEGQALVQDVAAQAQDPALIEARLQTRLLNAIASGITGASANYFNQPVAIVGAARMG